jgi:MFS family permease
MFLIALFLFTGASIACGQAQSLTGAPPLLFRIMQGAGVGILTPVGTAMLNRAYPPQERARMMRILLVPSSWAR